MTEMATTVTDWSKFKGADWVPPKLSDWTCAITSNFQLTPPVAPNRFHRFMQWLVLGFVWTKRK